VRLEGDGWLGDISGKDVRGNSDPPRCNLGKLVRLFVVPAGHVIKLNAIELVLEGSHGLAVRLHLVVVAACVFMTWSITSCESPRTSRRFTPISMAILRPQSRASYSSMLFDAGKWRRTTYRMCSLRGETKSKPAPAPVFITEPSKYRVQHSAWICGGGNCVSVHSATKSAKIWDLTALRGA
jgi:hypothetical protein